jgi:hypothetical protein
MTPQCIHTGKCSRYTLDIAFKIYRNSFKKILYSIYFKLLQIMLQNLVKVFIFTDNNNNYIMIS